MASLDQSSGVTSYSIPRGKLAATVAANALTVAIQAADGTSPSAVAPLYTAMPQTAGGGALFEGRQITTSPSFVATPGSTLGVINSGLFAAPTPFRVWILLFDDAGTFRLGAVLCTTVAPVRALVEYGVDSSVAEGGAGGADVQGTIYSTVAVTSKPFRIVGFLEWSSGLTTPGTWDTAPDIIQMFGPGMKLPGDLVSVAVNIGGLSTTSTAIPFDNTIPQSSEGVAYGIVQTTPRSKANVLMVEFMANVASDTAAIHTVAAIFLNSETDARAATAKYMASVNGLEQIHVVHIQNARAITQQSFWLRLGPSLNTATLTIGGTGGGFKFLSVMRDLQRVSEIMA